MLYPWQTRQIRCRNYIATLPKVAVLPSHDVTTWIHGNAA